MGLEVIIQLDEYNRINSELERHKREMDAIIQNKEVLIVGDSKLITEKGLIDESVRESLNKLKEEVNSLTLSQKELEHLVEKYESEINKLTETLTAKEGIIASLDKGVGTLNQEVNGLQYEIEKRDKEINTLCQNNQSLMSYKGRVYDFNNQSLLKRIVSIHV